MVTHKGSALTMGTGGSTAAACHSRTKPLASTLSPSTPFISHSGTGVSTSSAASIFSSESDEGRGPQTAHTAPQHLDEAFDVAELVLVGHGRGGGDGHGGGCRS